MADNNHLGHPLFTWELKNKPEWISSCEITEYSSGNVLLNWRGKDVGGEDGFFLTMKSCKTYVTQHITKVKSLWTKTEWIEYEQETTN